MSGHTPAVMADYGVSRAGAPFLAKPFSPDTLVRKLRAVLDSRSRLARQPAAMSF
jgi:DNA-binding response OmpR family regulator